MSPTARPQFESYQPTTVLDGQELTKNPRSRPIGATLSRIARRGDARVRARPGAARHSRSRWRSRLGARGRPAHGRPVEPVWRSLGADQSRGGPQDRSRARTGDTALRRECDRRARERHHRLDPVTRRRRAHPATSRSTSAATAARRAAPVTSTSATARSRCTSVAPAIASGNYETPEGEVDNSQSRTAHGPGRRVVDRRQVVRWRQLRLRRFEVRHSGRRRRPDQPDAASVTPSAPAPAVRISTAGCSRIAPPWVCAATSTRSSRATRSARPSTTTRSRAKCCCRTNAPDGWSAASAAGS